MADAIGSAYYELEARDTRARQTIDALESRIRASGGTAESAYATPVTRAVDRTAGAWDRAGAAAKGAGEALPTQRVGGFSGIMEGLRGRVSGAGSALGGFASTMRDRVGSAVDAAKDKLGGFGSVLGQVAGQAGQALTGPLAIGIGGGIAASIIGIGVAALGASAEMETYRTQFVTLLGSVDAAADRLDELAKFAAETPFELPNVVQASRTLEVFTNGALSTGDSLRIIGDAAASVNVPFEEVAFWTGRMYAAMKGGQPMGEMLMRLGEMGIIAPEVRTQIEQMSKGIAAGTLTMEEAWPRVEQAFGRFAGGMERQSQTLAGKFSTFMDDVRMSLARFGDRIAPLAKDALPALGTAIASIIDVLGQATETFGGFFVTVGEGLGHLENLANDLHAGSLAVGDFIRGAVGLPPILRTGSEAFREIRAAVVEAGGSFDDAKARITDLADSTDQDANRISERIAGFMESTGASFDEALRAVRDNMDGVVQAAYSAAGGVAERYGTGLVDGAPAVGAAAAEGITAPTAEELEKAEQLAAESGRAGSAAYASEIAGGADAVEQAWQAMLEGARNEMTKTERIASINAKLTSSRLTEALNSEDPYLRAQAVATRETLEAELELLEGNAHDTAIRTGKSLPDALEANREAARKAAYFNGDAVNIGLGEAEGAISETAERLGLAAVPPDMDMYGSGQRAGYAWADGLMSSAEYARAAGWEVAMAGGAALVAYSPPKEGPLADIDDSGGRVVQAWAGGMLREKSRVRSVGYELADAFRPEVAAAAAVSRPGALEAASMVPAALAPAGAGGGSFVFAPKFESIYPPSPEQARAAARSIIPQLQEELRRFGFVH